MGSNVNRDDDNLDAHNRRRRRVDIGDHNRHGGLDGRDRNGHDHDDHHVDGDDPAPA